jgi:DNA-directed RNA polymerase specialized sigma24 family protein
MTREDLKNYINNQKWIDEEKKIYKRQLEEVEDLKATVIDGLPKAHNKPNYMIENLLDKYNKILKYIDTLQDKQNEITKQLGKMNNSTYRLVLLYKYIEGLSIEEISVKMGKDYKYICNVHGYALNEFDNLEKILLNVEK